MYSDQSISLKSTLKYSILIQKTESYVFVLKK